MANNFNFSFGSVNLPEKITGRHFAVVAISGACTIAAHVGKAYINKRTQENLKEEYQQEKAGEPRGKKREHVANSSDMENKKKKKG